MFILSVGMQEVSDYVALQFYEGAAAAASSGGVSSSPGSLSPAPATAAAAPAAVTTRFMLSTNYPKRDIEDMGMSIEVAVRLLLLLFSVIMPTVQLIKGLFDILIIGAFSKRNALCSGSGCMKESIKIQFF